MATLFAVVGGVLLAGVIILGLEAVFDSLRALRARYFRYREGKALERSVRKAFEGRDLRWLDEAPQGTTYEIIPTGNRFFGKIFTVRFVRGDGLRLPDLAVDEYVAFGGKLERVLEDSIGDLPDYEEVKGVLIDDLKDRGLIPE